SWYGMFVIHFMKEFQLVDGCLQHTLYDKVTQYGRDSIPDHLEPGGKSLAIILVSDRESLDKTTFTYVQAPEFSWIAFILDHYTFSGNTSAGSSDRSGRSVQFFRKAHLVVNTMKGLSFPIDALLFFTQRLLVI